ncbi:hypothetical protein ARMSODRAFT_725425 [Armillaria solidipes]|uniref:Uncharacterized protein n=1 Tax=Armillaria solidipes TaxID=1076256 RepID=A0A2H3AP10_9AGAR|nr:hypothetical protein ARMSODRAFT_725425 [Armillaria solidipes]
MIAIVRQFAVPSMPCSIHAIVTRHTCYPFFFEHRLLFLAIGCLPSYLALVQVYPDHEERIATLLFHPRIIKSLRRGMVGC